jgi:hypothetical protein
MVAADRMVKAPAVKDALPVAKGSSYDELLAKARDLMKSTGMSEAQCFAKVYTAPENAALSAIGEPTWVTVSARCSTIQCFPLPEKLDQLGESTHEGVKTVLGDRARWRPRSLLVAWGRHCIDRRGSGPYPPLTIELPHPLVLDLRRAARPRDMTVAALVVALLDTAVHDNLISAILDIDEKPTDWTP